MFENDRCIGSLEMTHSVMPATPHTVRAAVSALCVCVCAPFGRGHVRACMRPPAAACARRAGIHFISTCAVHACMGSLACLINT
jgi:hypothetical protein